MGEQSVTYVTDPTILLPSLKSLLEEADTVYGRLWLERKDSWESDPVEKLSIKERQTQFESLGKIGSKETKTYVELLQKNLNYILS